MSNVETEFSAFNFVLRPVSPFNPPIPSFCSMRQATALVVVLVLALSAWQSAGEVASSVPHTQDFPVQTCPPPLAPMLST
jgi:hypothetical protein